MDSVTHSIWVITYTSLALAIVALIAFIVLALMRPHNERHEYQVILVPEDRDELAGEGATPQKRGRISREIVKEIKANYHFWKGEEE